MACRVTPGTMLLVRLARPTTLAARARTGAVARYTTTSGRTTEPLRILFCGSDAFSTEALHALSEEARFNPDLVRSIDVVVPPSRRTGRGLKTVSVPPALKTAEELALPCRQLDTFTGWEMPKEINLIIAVSFNLFVPPRLLQQAKYGGLNVHPSFLPDLRGPAPIHHAVLRGDEHVGASLQTLDAKKFDHGVVLAQTARPGLRAVSHWTLGMLTRKLAIEGAELLVDGLRRGLHVPPYSDVASQPEDTVALRHAPKIDKVDTEIRWDAWRAADWPRRLQLKQAVWTRVLPPGSQGSSQPRRLLLHDACAVEDDEVRGKRGVVQVLMTQATSPESGGSGSSTGIDTTAAPETATTTTALPDGLPRDGVDAGPAPGKATAAAAKGKHADSGSSDTRARAQTVSVDTRGGDVYFLLNDETWIRVRRATLEGKTIKPAAASLGAFVEWRP